MKKAVNESGITLIALVVTIIVLLILAGITVTYVLADGGIFDRAESAKLASEEGAIRDYMALAKFDVLAEHYDPTSTYTKTDGKLADADVLTIAQENFPTGYTLTATLTADTSGNVTGTGTVAVDNNGDGTTDNTYTVDFSTNEVEYQEPTT